MTRPHLRAELSRIRRRTGWAVVASVLCHLALLLLLPRTDPAISEERLLEISWVDDPAPPAASSPADPSAAETKHSASGELRAERSAPREHAKQFERKKAEAPRKPEPQRPDVARDLVRQRLASLEPRASDRRTQIASARIERFERKPVPSNPSGNVVPRELVRRGPSDERGEEPSLERKQLTRSRDLAVITAPTPVTKTHDSDSAREILAGVTLSGPVTDRPLLAYRTPVYPELAKREAIEGSVRLQFVVLPDGGVKDNVLVEKTSGFRDLDHNARLALLEWQFEPLPPGSGGEQWGTITLNYRLEDVR